MRRALFTLFLAALTLGGVLACRRDASPLGTPAGDASSVSNARIYMVRGVLRQPADAQGKLVIQHEAIPGYMEAMTMTFQAGAGNVPAGLNPGDLIAFRLLVTEEASWIDRVEKVGSETPQGQVAQAPGTATPPMDLSAHALRSYAFTNELGQPMRLNDLRGQVFALTFIFTRCPIPEYCPRLTKNFEEASRILAGRPGLKTNWHFLSVTIDPVHDTPEALKAYAERYGYDPAHWSFLTGPEDMITQLYRQSDVQAEWSGGQLNHNFRTLIVDAEGRLKQSIPVGGNLAELIAQEMVKAMEP